MLKPWLLFAATGPLDTTPPLEPGIKTGGMALQEILLLVGVAAVLALVLFLAVYIFRRNSRQRYSQGGAQVLVPAEHRDHHHSGGRRMKLKRKRRSHPDNLPRNPTLAEAGGLPPVRSEVRPENPH